MLLKHFMGGRVVISMLQLNYLFIFFTLVLGDNFLLLLILANVLATKVIKEN